MQCNKKACLIRAAWLECDILLVWFCSQSSFSNYGLIFLKEASRDLNFAPFFNKNCYILTIFTRLLLDGSHPSFQAISNTTHKNWWHFYWTAFTKIWTEFGRNPTLSWKIQEVDQIRFVFYPFKLSLCRLRKRLFFFLNSCAWDFLNPMDLCLKQIMECHILQLPVWWYLSLTASPCLMVTTTPLTIYRRFVYHWSFQSSHSYFSLSCFKSWKDRPRMVFLVCSFILSFSCHSFVIIFVWLCLVTCTAYSNILLLISLTCSIYVPSSLVALSLVLFFSSILF